MRLIDFSAHNIWPDQIKSAGYDGVIGYVSRSRPGGNFGAKPIKREYADGLRAEGLHIVSNFQYGKRGASAPPDFTRGFDGGVQDAQTAMGFHKAAGGPDSAPIIFTIDEDLDLPTWNNIGVDWFRGINSVLGVGRTGIYGHSRVCAWAIEDGVVGHSTTPGRRWAWQTKAWSLGEREPAAVLFQNVIDTQSNPGPLVDGTRVDVSDVLAEDFGQWDLDRSPPAGVVPPDFDESTEIRSPYCGPRRAQVMWFVLHTQEADSGSARNFANWLSHNDREASYHYALDNDGQLYNIIDTDQLSYSVFEPGNSKSINLAFTGSYAKWSRQAWFDRMGHAIDIAAFVAVRDARRHGLQPRVISPEEAKRGETGITDHNGVVIATGVGDHTDVGPGFPWDYFARKVAEFASLPIRSLERSAEQSYPGLVIAPGAAGRHVATLQHRLNTVANAGLLIDGEYAPLTSRAVIAFQKSRGLAADGKVGPKTWTELFAGDRIARRGSGERAIAKGIGPREVTGPGITSCVAMESADLGILRWDPDRGAIAAMFGDNFEFVGMQGEWLSPSIVMYDNNYNVIGIPEARNRIVTARRRQLWPYGHRNPDYDTVLPCDFIRVGDWWHVAVMLSQGPLEVEGAQFRTEFWRSRDLVRWDGPILKLDHVPGHPGAGILTSHPGNTMLTFDQIGDYVYIFGTGGIIRNKGIWMWRNRADEFPLGYWEPWGYDERGWNWGTPNEHNPIIEGEHGELCFRYIQGNCVLSFFDHSNYQQQARTVPWVEDDWRGGANFVNYVSGWDIPKIYGGYISPLSRLDEQDGMHFWVSQWVDALNYRVMLFKNALWARGELREIPQPAAKPLSPPVAQLRGAVMTSSGDGGVNGQERSRRRGRKATKAQGKAQTATTKAKSAKTTQSRTATRTTKAETAVRSTRHKAAPKTTKAKAATRNVPR